MADINEILMSYNVRRTYKQVADELEKVYEIRTELYGSVGLEQGRVFLEEPPILDIPREHITTVASMLNTSLIQRNVEGINKLLPSLRNYRLNLHPGAIISAAQHVDGGEGFCACFGRDAEYEGTAFQMVYDPHIAVLEPIDEYGNKKNGFQMVFLGTTGLHAYGGHYSGSVVAPTRAMNLVRAVVTQLHHCKPPERDLSVYNDLYYVGIISYSRKNHYPERLRALNEAAVDGASIPEPRDTGERWYPISSSRRSEPDAYDDAVYDDDEDDCDEEYHSGGCVYKAYEEERYFGGYFDTGISEITRPYLPYEVERARERVLAPAWRNCSYCGEDLTYEDRTNNNFVGGENYGLSGIYCNKECLIREINYRASDEKDNIYVINGKMYSLPTSDEEGEDSGAENAA